MADNKVSYMSWDICTCNSYYTCSVCCKGTQNWSMTEVTERASVRLLLLLSLLVPKELFIENERSCLRLKDEVFQLKKKIEKLKYVKC